MRATSLLVPLLLAGLACTDGLLEAEQIDDEAALDGPLDERLLELVPAPEHSQPPAPAPEPYPARELEPSEEDGPEWTPVGYGTPAGPPRLVFDERGHAGPCSFGVRAQGLPAVNRESEQVLNLELEGALGPTDWDTSVLALVWRDFDDELVAREQLYDSDDLAEGDPYDAPRVYCARARPLIEARMDELNALLDAEPLVPMISQPIQLEPMYGEAPPLADRGNERPVELRYTGGQLVARVRGIAVIARLARPSWQGEPNTLDAYNPNILALYGDREAGVAVVERSYESASCMSDAQTYAGVVRLPEAVFAEIERRQHLAFEPHYGY